MREVARHEVDGTRAGKECALGVLGVGCFPEGDWDVPLPLADETLSSDDQLFDEGRDRGHRVPTARTWVEVFGLCLISGLMWERRRVIGPLLREDYAPAIRSGVPYSRFDAVSEPADLAEMDALCAYLTVVSGRYPGSVPGPVPVARPGEEERAGAARALDEAGALGPDQRLLRVLLDDDREAFERALADRLEEHRASVGADPAPRTLLPAGAVTLAALAHLAHGWEPGVRSGYLPEALLRAPVSVQTEPPGPVTGPGGSGWRRRWSGAQAVASSGSAWAGISGAVAGRSRRLRARRRTAIHISEEPSMWAATRSSGTPVKYWT